MHNFYMYQVLNKLMSDAEWMIEWMQLIMEKK